MIQSSSSIHNLVVNKAKKMRSQEQNQNHQHQHQHHLGFNFKLMGCTASDVVDPQRKTVYYKLDHSSSSSSSNGRSCNAGGFSIDVPKGCLAVYVGEERRRYIIRTHLLNHPVFRALLDKSAVEFGFKQSGGLKFACDTQQFEQLLLLVKKGERGGSPNSSGNRHS